MNKRFNRKITKKKIKMINVEVKQIRNEINLSIIIIKKGEKREKLNTNKETVK